MNFALFIILLQISSEKSKDLPETKHLEGWVFGWPDALILQRKMWNKIPIPKIKFYTTDLNISKITDKFIADKLDFNLSQIIQDMVNSIQDSLNAEGNPQNSTDEDNQNLSLVLKSISNVNLNSVLNFKKTLNENSQCIESEHPNAYFFNELLNIGPFDNIDCETEDELIGQILSFILVIVPIIVIFILSLLFYLVFTFLRCCCCKAKKNFNPGIISIIFFIIITIGLVISLILNIFASTYMLKIIDYVFSKKVLKEVETACRLVNPSINNGIRKMVNQLGPSIESISNESVTLIDNSLPSLLDVLNASIENIISLSSIIKDIYNYGNKNSEECTKREDKFNQCSRIENEKLSKQCKPAIDNISLISKFTSFSSAGDLVNELDAFTSNISGVINVSSFIDTGKQYLVDAMDGLRESIESIDNVSIGNDICDIGDSLDILDKLPSFVLPIIKAIFFIMPAIMLVFIVLQVLAFWTKCCCSRCIAACCVPCVFCTCCQFFTGLFCTIFGIFILLMNIFYDQGDDVLDTILKKATNENKVINFGSLNLFSVTNNVIGTFPLDSIKLNKIHFIKNFVDAKLDSTFANILSLNEMPFNDMANMLEKALKDASNSTNLDSLIIGPVKDVINQTKSSLPDSNLVEFANIEEMNKQLDIYRKAVDKCYSSCSRDFDSLSGEYIIFFNGFNQKIEEFNQSLSKISPILDEIPSNVSAFSYDLFGGLLVTIGEQIGSSLRLIIPLLDKIDMKWLIGLFNIVRVRFCYNLFASILCISLSAHLFIVCMSAMSILLLIRRRGMAKHNRVENTTENESESLSSASDKKE